MKMKWGCLLSIDSSRKRKNMIRGSSARPKKNIIGELNSGIKSAATRGLRHSIKNDLQREEEKVKIVHFS